MSHITVTDHIILVVFTIQKQQNYHCKIEQNSKPKITSSYTKLMNMLVMQSTPYTPWWSRFPL